VKRANTPHRFGEVDFLGFEAVTLVPIQSSLVIKELLTMEEVDWLNAYHAKCLAVIGPLMDPTEDGFKWLLKACRPI
jgi:Xaa-Pro aminopeptidase